jgi:hypothetical protein
MGLNLAKETPSLVSAAALCWCARACAVSSIGFKPDTPPAMGTDISLESCEIQAKVGEKSVVKQAATTVW